MTDLKKPEMDMDGLKELAKPMLTIPAGAESPTARRQLPTVNAHESAPASDGIDFGAVSSASDFLSTDLGLALTHVLLALETDGIPPGEVERIREALPMESTHEARGKTSIVKEIEAQVKMIRGLRNKVLTPGGQLKGEYELKDAKYVIQSADAALKTLMSHQKELTNIENIQKLEQAISMAIEDMEPATQQAFLTGVEKARKELG